VWLSDRTRPFVVVLIEADVVDHRLGASRTSGSDARAPPRSIGDARSRAPRVGPASGRSMAATRSGTSRSSPIRTATTWRSPAVRRSA
jgi:hypothetical protein